MASVRCHGGLLLTYPKFAAVDEVINLEEIKTELLAQLGGYVRSGKTSGFDRGVVAKELHKDTVSTTDGVSVPGMQHLHVYLHCKLNGGTQFRIKHSDLDLRGHHGNYLAIGVDNGVAKYCQKDGDYIWWGQDPVAREALRKRHRSVALAGLMNGTDSLDDVVLEFPNLLPQYAQLLKGLNYYKAARRLRKDGGAPTFLYLMGPSGAGKTSVALSLSDRVNIYLVPLQANASTWFDGYQGEPVVVFDNVSPLNVPAYDLICRLVDRSPLIAPTKGGHTTMWPAIVVVTSVHHPTAVWPMWDVQLARRLTSLWVAEPVLMTMPVMSGSRFVPIVTVTDYRWKVEPLSTLTPGLTAGTVALMSCLRSDPTRKTLPTAQEVDLSLSEEMQVGLTADMVGSSLPPTMLNEGGRLFNRSKTSGHVELLDAYSDQDWGCRL